MDSIYVNSIFRRDIKAILGFDPWRQYKTIQFFSQSVEYNFFIAPTFMDELKIYRKNLKYTVDTYFTWNSSEFPDPLDQYIWIEANMKDVIIPRLLEGLSKSVERDIYNLRLSVELWFTNLAKHLYKCGHTHKFQYDDRDAHIDEY